MENYGKSLHLDDPKYIPAQHFQNHRVPPDMACYACHTDYTIYGPFKDKLKGLTRIYMQYVSTPPNPITIPGGFRNAQCLHCHAGAREFRGKPHPLGDDEHADLEPTVLHFKRLPRFDA